MIDGANLNKNMFNKKHLNVKQEEGGKC